MKQLGELGATLKKYQALSGIGNTELSMAMRISTATFYRKARDDNFSANELRLAARKLKIPKGELAI